MTPDPSRVDSRSRTIVITGASDGVGAAAADQLAGRGHRLILVGRSPEKLKAVADRVGAEYHAADFASLDEVRDLAVTLNASCDRIDVLANNAGGIFSGPTRTVDGFEKTFQVNHLAHVLLTHLLMDRLLASKASVVNTSSVAAKFFGQIDMGDLDTFRSFSPNRAYGNSKLANILFTKGLHNAFHGQGLSAVAFHPGGVRTNFASDTTSFMRWAYRTTLNRFLISAERGGANLTHFIDGTPGVEWNSGEYYDGPRQIGRTNKQADDADVVREHWSRSANLLNIDW